MNFDEAVDYVVKEKAIAYSYQPEKRGNKIIGCEMYILSYNHAFQEHPEDEDEFNIKYTGGAFYSSSGEEGFYGIDDVPNEAKKLSYIPAKGTKFDTDNEIQVTLKQLNGVPEGEAFSDYPCENCDEILFETGVYCKCEKCKETD